MKLAYQTDDGIGTRANLGVIVLETDETLEHEFRQLVKGDGIALYVSRIPMVPEVRPDTLAQMETALPTAAGLLPTALDFDAIGFGCTSASSVIGSDRVADIVAATCSGAQVTDPLAAIIAAGRALDAQRLGFVTPYVADVSARMRHNLELAGFEIASFGSFEEGNDRVVARITPASIVAAVEAVSAKAPCDAIVVSCTNLRCLGIIAEAERKTGVPVITSNQALAWHMLTLAGVEGARPGLGRLFA
ncbi:aspartate/glutamate racemase family protein [uncultured Roseobacter sp.]|uniref:maleate cis-trans isomerase family protein n=1 Tax=uncultured Roseobacter sp. TaxID=114847 RepID=UPI0026213F94|nr:aspartate/glutamate racemase family protein [uncultured Roseobacter sp.]